MASQKAATQPLLLYETLEAQQAEGKAGSSSWARGTVGTSSHGTARKPPGLTQPCSHGPGPLCPPSSVSLLTRQAQPAVRREVSQYCRLPTPARVRGRSAVHSRLSSLPHILPRSKQLLLQQRSGDTGAGTEKGTRVPSLV